MWHGPAPAHGERSDGAFGWRFGDTDSCMEWMEGRTEAWNEFCGMGRLCYFSDEKLSGIVVRLIVTDSFMSGVHWQLPYGMVPWNLSQVDEGEAYSLPRPRNLILLTYTKLTTNLGLVDACTSRVEDQGCRHSTSILSSHAELRVTPIQKYRTWFGITGGQTSRRAPSKPDELLLKLPPFRPPLQP